MRVGLICSTGGHLAQLAWIRAFWERHDRFWVTFDKPDARELLEGERVYFAHHPVTRNVPNLLRNAALAARVLRRERPDVLVSNGAGVAVPFFWAARALGIATVFIEVYDRIDRPSLTARLVAPVADRMVVQWEEQERFFRGAVNLGSIA